VHTRSMLYPNLHSKVDVTQETNFPGILITLTCLSLFKFCNCSVYVFSGIYFLALFFVLVVLRVLGSHLETHLVVDFFIVVLVGRFEVEICVFFFLGFCGILKHRWNLEGWFFFFFFLKKKNQVFMDEVCGA